MQSKTKSETNERFRTLESVHKPSYLIEKQKVRSVVGHSQTDHPGGKSSLIISRKTDKLVRKKMHSLNSLKPILHKKSKNPPYQKFIKELNIHLPTPKDKFFEFLDIAPFNRLNNHIEFISHILQKFYYFFQKHPKKIVDGLSRKIIKVEPNSIPTNFYVVVDEGLVRYKGKAIERGQIIPRKMFNRQWLRWDEQTTLIGFPKHEYVSFVSQYLSENFDTYKNFLSGLQIFKIFPQQALSKIYSSLSLYILTKGESLYVPNEEANELFVLFSGKVLRKVIVEIEQTNKIPLGKSSRLYKILSKSYEHKIEFGREDLVGVGQIIEKMSHHAEEIVVEEDCIVLAIDRMAIEDNLDEYIIDRLKKYNIKRYPKNYDQLCENFLKEKLEGRKAQERKIAALKDELITHPNGKRNEKINSIIKLYQHHIKKQNRNNLLSIRCKEKVVDNDT